MSGRHKWALLVAIAIGIWLVWPKGAGQRLTFLSVGQGDCTVWQDGRATILIDTGPLTRQGFDAGERIVLPKLRKLGVRSVDVVIITHPDSDHIGGLRAIVKRYPSARIVASEEFREDDQMRWWLKEAAVDPSRAIWVKGVSKVDLPHSRLTLAAPELLPGASDNDGSLFVKIEAGNSSAIITGDASMDTEDRMNKSLAWTGQVLKAGHHGSRTSTSDAFLRKTRAGVVVVSCGKSNPFGHPHPSVLAAIQRAGCVVKRTDIDGDVAFEPSQAGFRLRD